MKWSAIRPQIGKKIPLDPPLIKGEVGVDPFNKGVVRVLPFSKGETEGIS
jgi:hypothetical protein